MGRRSYAIVARWRGSRIGAVAPLGVEDRAQILIEKNDVFKGQLPVPGEIIAGNDVIGLQHTFEGPVEGLSIARSVAYVVLSPVDRSTLRTFHIGQQRVPGGQVLVIEP